jgi:uncharacterized protein (DUF433 family)
MPKAKSWRKLISIDAKVMGGKPVIKGTRVPVQVIVGHLGAGETVTGVCREYHLSKQAVLASISYAAALVSKGRALPLP